MSAGGAVTDAVLTDLAHAAARCWGGCEAPPRLVALRENAVFDVVLRSGERVALRLHRPGNCDPAAVETELAWTAALADAGIACPRPLRTGDGALVVRVSDRLVSVIRWVGATPLSETTTDPERQYHRLGACLADLHQAADHLALCPVPRQTWKANDLIGAAPRWGGYWRNPTLSAQERAQLATAAEAARAALADIAQPDVGLIHADTLRENVLDDGKRLWLIDFDDSGWGYRGYDLGTALIQHLGSPALPMLQAALVDGYCTRRPQTEALAAQIPLFVLIRGLVTAGWIVPRVPRDDPRQRIYAERALKAADLFIAA